MLEEYLVVYNHITRVVLYIKQYLPWRSAAKAQSNIQSLEVSQKVTGQLADTPTRELVSSWTGKMINFCHHQQHHQLHVHKAEEQNVCNKQENMLHRTFSYLQIPTET